MIYFVQGQKSKLVKIGYSRNATTFKARLSQLQCQNADKLTVLRTMAGGRLTETGTAPEAQAIAGSWRMVQAFRGSQARHSGETD